MAFLMFHICTKKKKTMGFFRESSVQILSPILAHLLDNEPLDSHYPSRKNDLNFEVIKSKAKTI